uniref:Major facilitator superfamily (MFS) profile domain-containing protein n=1 Tax=Salix viminalis TaxID=40686 RepID=A0A6N2LMW5_SALVM
MVSSPPPPPPPSSSGDKDPNPTRRILGLGFWIQGFRCLPWMAINFFLKDGLHVDPSTLQLLQNSANLPMVAFLQSVSWLAIAILSPSGISIITLSLCLLLSNLGASIAEVANDAIVAETGKQPAVPPEKSRSYSSGELQSFVWIASSAGGALGNLLGGIAITIYGPQAMFLLFSLTVALQLFIIITVRESSLNLPRSSSRVGLRKQLSELSVALQKPEIARSITWLAASNAIVPALTGTMFFYQTQYLNINSSVLGISKVFGQAAMLLWSLIYNRFLKSVPSKKLIAAIQGVMAVFMLSDVLFVNGVYRRMGVPDLLYVIVFSGLVEVLFFFKLLPFNILMAQLCPSGCEGSLMAFVASATALSFIVSGYLGVALSSFVGVTGSDFSGFPRALLIQAVCTVLPVYWSSCIPDDKTSRNRKNE